MIRRVVIACITVTALAACGPKEDSMSQPTAEEVAATARAEVDALAHKLGTDPQVRQDALDDCTPGDRDSGKILSYIVRVQVAEGAIDRLRGEIAEDLAGQGWTVKIDTNGAADTGESVRFQKGSATLGASVFDRDGYAVVLGSGGCVT